MFGQSGRLSCSMIFAVELFEACDSAPATQQLRTLDTDGLIRRAGWSWRSTGVENENSHSITVDGQ